MKEEDEVQQVWNGYDRPDTRNTPTCHRPQHRETCGGANEKAIQLVETNLDTTTGLRHPEALIRLMASRPERLIRDALA